ncbi:MAG: MATE family efflux transporter [Ruminococcaceae bacterium]|nr:MATE family efflux transporter [Oscillospiraceae bacterium]
MATALRHRSIDMCNGPILKKAIIFAIPVFITSILQLLFNAADLMVVGNFCGSRSVAAVGATTSLCSLFVNLFVGIASGVGVAVATAVGAKDNDRVRKTVHTTVPLAALCGAIINIAIFALATPMLNLMETPSDIINLSSLYMKIYSFGMIPSMVYNFSAAILRAKGDTVRPLMYLTVAGIVNVALNLVFVLFFNMDVGGVALATSLSKVVSAVWVIIDLIRREDECKFYFSKMRFYAAPIKKILAIGIPAGIQSSMFSISNITVQSSVNSFESEAIAGAAAGQSIDAFSATASTALQQTALNFTGQNFGAKKFDRIVRVWFICTAMVVISELFLGSLLNIFSYPLLSLYVKDSAVALSYGAKRMMLVSGFHFLMGSMNVAASVIRGMGYSISTMLLSLFANCGLRIIWVLTVFKHFRASKYAWQILYSVYPVSWILVFIAMSIICVIIIKKHKRKDCAA